MSTSSYFKSIGLIYHDPFKDKYTFESQIRSPYALGLIAHIRKQGRARVYTSQAKSITVKLCNVFIVENLPSLQVGQILNYLNQSSIKPNELPNLELLYPELFI